MDFNDEFDGIPDIGENAYYSDEENSDCCEDLDPIEEWEKDFEEEGIL